MDILEEKQLQANCSAGLLPHGGTNDLLQYIVLQHEGQRAEPRLFFQSRNNSRFAVLTFAAVSITTNAILNEMRNLRASRLC